MTEEIVLVCTCGRTQRVPANATGAVFVCPGCRASIECAEANTRPLTQTERDVDLFVSDEEEPAPAPPRSAQAAPPAPGAPPPVSAPVASEAASCPSCGRAFRGDWDRVDVAGQIVCNMCARSVKLLDAGVKPTEPPLPTEVSETTKALRNPSWGLKGVEARSKHILTTEERRKRRLEMIGLGIVAAVVVAVVNLWPEGEQTTRSAADIAKDLPAHAATVSWIVDWSLRLLAAELTIYLTLRSIDQLANDHLWADLLVICPVAVLVTAASVIPLAGHLLGLMLVYAIYDLPGAGVLYVLLVRLLTWFLSWTLNLLVAGTIVNLFT